MVRVILGRLFSLDFSYINQREKVAEKKQHNIRMACMRVSFIAAKSTKVTFI